MKQQAQGQGTLTNNGGETTDRPKSDGVTAEHSCPARRVRMSAVSFTKGERECPWAAGSVVGLALHKGNANREQSKMNKFIFYAEMPLTLCKGRNLSPLPP